MRLALQRLIKRNIEIKSQIVAKDERDRTGERALLNFGHTVGHAIERAGNYSKFLHGEAVSLGIVAACAISVTKAGLRPEQRDAIVSLLKQFGLPTRLPSKFPRKKIFDAVKVDKKFEDGKIRFVVTPRIGAALHRRGRNTRRHSRSDSSNCRASVSGAMAFHRNVLRSRG